MQYSYVYRAYFIVLALILNIYIPLRKRNASQVFDFWTEKTTNTQYRSQLESILSSKGCNRKKGIGNNLIKEGYNCKVHVPK